jgi:hypothetical protein
VVTKSWRLEGRQRTSARASPSRRWQKDAAVVSDGQPHECKVTALIRYIIFLAADVNAMRCMGSLAAFPKVRWYTLCGTNRCTCVPTCSPCIAPTQPLHSGRTRPLGHAQEDQCVAVAIPGLPEHYLFGVFDGHGGAACAKAAAGHDEGVLR